VSTTLAERLNDALPQTQCTRCGWPDCRGYAQAITKGQAAINQCQPGGAEGILRLAAITGHDAVALDAERGSEGPRQVMFIDEAWCIGCTLCIAACPVDCIVGAPKRMHTIIEAQCTGCELCLPACPVDCIAVEVATPGASGWAAWSAEQANEARARYEARQARAERTRAPAASVPANSGAADDLVQAALRRARERAGSKAV
jgi:Na+-translocating ferredoxin:NAD+ oxidoreductase subunit B